MITKRCSIRARYDIGFGLFFEWSKSPTEQVSVHISDSEDDDDDDEDPDNEGSTSRPRQVDK